MDCLFLIYNICTLYAEANEKEADKMSEKLQSVGISTGGVDGFASGASSGLRLFIWLCLVF